MGLKNKILLLILMLFLFTDVVHAESTIQIESKDVTVDETFSINISCVQSEPIKGWELKIRFDPSIISINSVSEGDLFEGYSTFFNIGTIDNNAGTIIDVYCLIIGKGNVSSSGTLINIEFKAIAIGETTVSLYDVGICNETQYLVNNVNDGRVVVNSEEKQDVEPGSDKHFVSNISEEPTQDESLRTVIVTCTIFICLLLYIGVKLI
jgi:hypothetical protein